MRKISPFLWFDDQAEEAACFYVSVFKDARIGDVARYGEAGPGPKGTVMTIDFEIEGETFTALNGGPLFKFNESVSFQVRCQTQAEVDGFWEKLIEGGGEHSQCGWLKDRFGLSWQVVPDRLTELMRDPDARKARRVTEAMLQMTKLDIAKLEAAYAG